MTEIYVAIITSIVAPVILFVCQLIRDKKHSVEKKISYLQIQVLRFEILMNLHHRPDDEATILHLYDEYKKYGGNSYIKTRIEEWQKSKKKTKKSK